MMRREARDAAQFGPVRPRMSRATSLKKTRRAESRALGLRRRLKPSARPLSSVQFLPPQQL